MDRFLSTEDGNRATLPAVAGNGESDSRMAGNPQAACHVRSFGLDVHHQVRGELAQRVDGRLSNLNRANLTGANLSGAEVNFAELTGANLSGAKLKDAGPSAAFKQESEQGVSVVTFCTHELRGHEQCSLIKTRLNDLVDSGLERLILDFRNVEYIGSAFLSVLVGLWKKLSVHKSFQAPNTRNWVFFQISRDRQTAINVIAEADSDPQGNRTLNSFRSKDCIVSSPVNPSRGRWLFSSTEVSYGNGSRSDSFQAF